MKKRQLKKLLKNSKDFMEITLKYEDVENGNKVLVHPNDVLNFHKSTISFICEGITYTHISYNGIGEIKSLRKQMFRCSICGKIECTDNWMSSCAKKLVKYQMCFECNHWREQKEQDATIRGKHGFAIVNGVHYVLAQPTDGPFQGFGGRKWTFKFHDGSIVECNNVWYQGNINEAHPHWREVMPDNAIIINNK